MQALPDHERSYWARPISNPMPIPSPLYIIAFVAFIAFLLSFYNPN